MTCKEPKRDKKYQNKYGGARSKFNTKTNQGFVSDVRRKLAGAEQLNRGLGLGWVSGWEQRELPVRHTLLHFPPRVQALTRSASEVLPRVTEVEMEV